MSGQTQVFRGINEQRKVLDQRKIIKRALAIFLPVFILMVVVTSAVLMANESSEMKEYEDKEWRIVDLQTVNIDRDIQHVSSDLALLVHQREMVELWNDEGVLVPEVLSDLTAGYLEISIHRALYDQVRLIDEKGMEIIRVNFNNGHPIVVPQNELQNKRGRYYFDDAFKLDQGEVFVSPFDLNIEHGEIEQPLKPMIRFAIPVFDQRGTKRGIVLLNYFGEKLLERFSYQVDISRGSQAMLINADGYWLAGPSSEDEWGFMYEDRKDLTFANAYPEAWERITSDEASQFETVQGLFTFKTVYPLLEGQKSSTGAGEAFASSKAEVEAKEYHWKIVSFVPADVLYADRNKRRLNAALIMAILSMVIFLGVWQVTKDSALRRQVEAALREEEKYRQLFENAVAGVDISNIAGRVLAMNRAMSKITGYTLEEFSTVNLRDTYVNLDDRRKFLEIIKHDGIVENFQVQLRNKKGDSYWASFSSRSIIYDSEEAFLTTALDITEQVQIAGKLNKANRLYATLSQINQAIVKETDKQKLFQKICNIAIEFGRFKFAWIGLVDEEKQLVNPVAFSGEGFDYLQNIEISLSDDITVKEPTGRSIREERRVVFNDLENNPDFSPWREQALKEGYRSSASFPLRLNNSVIGSLNVYAIEPNFFDGDETSLLEEAALDISFALEKFDEEERRKHVEQALKKYTDQLETLNTVTAALSMSLELDKVLELIIEQIGQVIPMDSGAIFLHEKDGVRVMVDRGIIPSAQGLVFPARSELFGEIEQRGKPLVLGNVKGDSRFQNWGQSVDVESWMGVPLIVRDTLIGFLTIDNNQPDAYSPEQSDLAQLFASQAAQAIENARQYNAAQRRMRRLDSLHKIDQTITGSLDLKVTLNVLLDHLMSHLEVDAAAVLNYEKVLQVLTFSYGKGFRTTALQNTNFRLGQGVAGEAALQRQPLFIPDLTQHKISFSESRGIKEEGFFAYYGFPLIAKGALVGMLEVFHRSPLALELEWENYLKTLAGQAAIAIDNIALFDDLEHSNVRLMQAYDATIEGWAQALEMRDMETEGHSRRVVKITMDLAKMFNTGEEALLNIRRGALLHDIGKMGVPDAILQKPGKFTDAEWTIMRQHPVYAYEWLSPIEYLRPALDIPYCHHEKWDGTGYPRGLKGEQIPIAARLFAVVDVWDALCSDRPYRKAWSKEKTLNYIKKQSGKYFDPEVVDVFMMLMHSEKK